MEVVLWTLLQTTSFFLRNNIRLSLVSQFKSCGNNLVLSADQFQEKEVKKESLRYWYGSFMKTDSVYCKTHTWSPTEMSIQR